MIYIFIDYKHAKLVYLNIKKDFIIEKEFIHQYLARQAQFYFKVVVIIKLPHGGRSGEVGH